MPADHAPAEREFQEALDYARLSEHAPPALLRKIERLHARAVLAARVEQHHEDMLIHFGVRCRPQTCQMCATLARELAAMEGE